MRVQQVRVDAAGRTHEAREQSWNAQSEPRPTSEVAEHAVAEGQTKAAKLLRPHDLDVDAATPHVLDGVGDEPARGVAGIPRVRRGQHSDPHQLWIRKTA